MLRNNDWNLFKLRDKKKFLLYCIGRKFKENPNWKGDYIVQQEPYIITSFEYGSFIVTSRHKRLCETMSYETWKDFIENQLKV